MTLQTELDSMFEQAITGQWDVQHLEDRHGLFGGLSPEKACFIGSVCAFDALNDVRNEKQVSDASAHLALEAFTELDDFHDFGKIYRDNNDSAVRRLIVARHFWQMRIAGDISGHMFVSAEPENHDLVGVIDVNPTLWRIDKLPEDDGFIEVGGLFVAQTTLIESVDPEPEDEITNPSVVRYLSSHRFFEPAA